MGSQKRQISSWVAVLRETLLRSCMVSCLLVYTRQLYTVLTAGRFVGRLLSAVPPVDYVASHPSISRTTRVSGFPQSGYFPNRGVMDDWMHFQYDSMNISRTMNQACQSHNAKVPETCIYGDVNAPFVKTPLFLWQSATDADQLGGDDLQPACHESSCAVPFAKSMRESMNASVLQHTRNGGFVDCCHHHCGDYHAMLSDTGFTRGEALAKWYKGSTRLFNQSAAFAAAGFPCKSCCGG